MNLGGNAVKFTQRGGVTIQAKVVAEDGRNVTLDFAITDTGIGIPKDKQSILFSPFTQVDGSTTRKYGGSGLGLAICRQLVNLMGGQIGIKSEEGKGSTFWFRVVFEKAPATEANKPQALAGLQSLKALVVDDQETNRLLVTTLLKSWGLRFAEAMDGEKALAALREAAHDGDPFRIALVDMLMPILDGAELGRRIKADPEIRETRLIMMTSLGQRGDAARLEEIGFSGYLTKPVRQSQLRECLELVMGRTASGAEKLGLVTRHTIAELRKRRVRILLAEDNPTNQMLALKIMEKMGYRADAVANGREALEALRATHYDLVLMDCQMPEMDGFEAARCIRSKESGVPDPGIPIIALTAHAMKGDRERCVAAGMNDYLAKPFRPEELARALDRWLGKAADDRDADGALAKTSPTVQPGETSAKQTGSPPNLASVGEMVFDRDGFMSRIMGDVELARALTEGFLADIPAQIELLKAAVASGDGRLAGQLGHRIKGAAANMGGIGLQRLAHSMELAGKEGALKKLEALMPQVVEQFEFLRGALEKAWSP
jgi:CheY-like chemotaxis protein/HPt (histidine-containing phosphotransfer) domain-containing protein